MQADPHSRSLGALDAVLVKFAEASDRLAAIGAILERMDHAQDALLANGHSLQGQMENIAGLLNHMIEVLTPERPEQEGPSLADLLGRLITQQAALADLMKHTLEAVTRLEQRALAHASLAAPGRA
jgi:hypothetical protein